MDYLNEKNKRFNFDDLFILDMANNHQGSVQHGLKIIREHARQVKNAAIRAAVKFQFRNLDTFIHPKHKIESHNKHVKRFLSTHISESDYKVLKDEVSNQGLLTMSTPFDELSVDMITKFDIDIIKIASCSATDWPLLQAVSEAGKPVIVSTAGLSLKEVDSVVSFFDHRGVDYAIMHCVALYPTPDDKLKLQRIEIFKNRYPNLTIGYSTHEDPKNLDAIKIAYSKGARIFERHIGKETNEIKLNAYSSTPEQIGEWFDAYKKALAYNAEFSETENDEEEKNSLASLARGVYAKKPIKEGSVLKRSDVFFAMPLEPGQLSSGKFKEGMVSDKSYGLDEALSQSLVPEKITKKQIIYQNIHAVKGMLNAGKIFTNHEANVELSHHYGLENFQKIGVTIIDCINREYCKKIIVMVPGQTHPSHYHKKKEETFQILAGSMEVEIEGRTRVLYAGDTLLIPRGVWHSFTTKEGVIFEEISTTHYSDDSFYSDKEINNIPREKRKTRLIHWGRHQFESIEENKI